MFDAIWNILLELAPWLLLGAAVSGVLHVVIPPGWLQRQLSGPSGVVKAVALGVPLPLCSCGVIPAGLGLKKDGASDGATVGFLISTPQTGVDSVLVAASFLGWPFALFKLGAAALTGLVGGLLTESFATPPAAPPPVHDPSAPRRGVRDGFDHGLELLRMIWRWVVFGVLVSALLTVFVPADSVADTVLGSGPVAVLAVLALSVPLYVCATASVPIAAALVGAGLPTGAALVFLMAGPATNIATIGAVSKAFGPRVLGIYLGTVIGGSVVLGLAFDAVWGATTLAAVAHHHHSWWAAASAVVLLGLTAWFALDDVRGWLRARGGPVSDLDQVFEIAVDGMNCGGCSSKLDGFLWKVQGVTAVDVSHEENRARVQGLMEREAVLAAIREAGFKPVSGDTRG